MFAANTVNKTRRLAFFQYVEPNIPGSSREGDLYDGFNRNRR